MTKLFLFDNNENLIGAVDPLEGKETNELNKLHTLEVVVNYNDLVDKAVFIGHKDYKQKDVFHLYKIDRVDKESTTHVKITAVHKFFDDMESDGYIKDYRPQNKELVGVLTTLLNGSSWQLGTVNVQRLFSGNFYYVSRKEALSKLVEETQIEISPRLEFTKGKITARYLDVFTRMGRDNGKVFIHGKDLLTVHEKNSKGAIYTAVIGRGKGEEVRDEDGQATGGYGRRITFKDVVWEKIAGKPVDKPAGEEMLEIPALTKIYGFEKGTKPRVKIVEFQDEEDPERLIMLSYEWLKKNSRVQVEYKATVRNVGELDLGDTVGVYNPKLGIKYKTRVFKVVRNLTDNNLTEFGIGDKVTSSPFSRTIELAKDVKNFQDDTIYWLDKIRERLSDKFLNEDGYNYDLKTNNKYELPAGYYSFDKPIEDNPTKVVYMGAGKIAIADSKKPTGEWNWKTFLDGKGATLDLINTGILKAGRIQAADGRSYWDLDTGDFHLEQGIVEKTFKNIVEGKAQEIVDEVKKSIPNMEGIKGKDAYIHKKYSNNADGSDMGDNSNSKYMGIYTGDKKTPPTDPKEYSWTKIKEEGKLYKGYANSLNGLDFTVVEPDDNSSLLAKNSPHVNITNDEDISDIWQANMFLSLQPNTKYTLTARAKGNNNKLWAYFRNAKTNNEYSWGQLEFGNTLETKSIFFTTGNEDVEEVLFKFILVPEDEDWTGVQVDWYTIHEGYRAYPAYPTNEPAQYHKYRYFGYVNKESTPVASDFDWFDIQQKSITGDKYTHLVYSDSADGSGFGRSPKKYMGIARTTSPVQPTDKTAYKWVRVQGEDGVSAANFNLLRDTLIKDSSAFTLNGAAPTINSNDYNGKNSVEINNKGLRGNAWKGISFRSDKKIFRRGEKIAIRLPIYIYSDVTVDNGIHLALKSHVGNKQMAGFDLATNTPRDTWVVKEFVYEVQQEFVSQSDNLFFIFSTKNGHFKIAEPYMSTGDNVPSEWMPNVNDLKPENVSNLNYLPNSNFETALNKWELSNLQNSGLEYRTDDAITHFGRGLHIFGTPNGEFKGLSSEPFNLEAKKDEKLTLSMDLGKDALTDNSVIKLGLHFMDKNGTVILQQWNDLDLAAQGFEVKKYKRISQTFTVPSDMAKCRVMIYATNNQRINFYIDKIKLEAGEVATDWQPCLEDLKPHTLTTNVRFEGKYVNKKTTGVKAYLEVFYDNEKLTKGFTTKMKYKGADRTEWSEFTNVTVGTDGSITGLTIPDGPKNGEPIDVITLTTYNGISNLAREKLEDKPDVTGITEIVEKYKTFDNTIENFNSTIGEFREQIINGGRNLIKNSADLSDVETATNNWKKSVQNGVLILTKHNVTDNEGVYFKIVDFLRTEYQGAELTLSIDIKASKDITFTKIGPATGGVKKGTFEITPQWKRFTHTFTNAGIYGYSFQLEGMQGVCGEGDKIYFRFPKLEKGTTATPWTPAPEDVNLVKERLESSINQTKDQLGLTVKKNEVISAINLSTEGNEGRVKIDADRVDIKGALRAYKGYIGGFQLGKHEGDGYSSWWLTGENQFYVGMSNGAGNWGQTALWVNWGNKWNEVGPNAWYVKENGEMYCKNRAYFWNTPTVVGDLKVTGNIIFSDGKGNYGKWVYSHEYERIEYNKGYIYFYKQWGGVYDWVDANKEISDRRYKKNIQDSKVNALDILNKLKAYSYTKEYDGEVKDIDCGIMAQDVKEHINSAFIELPDGAYSYSTFELLPYAIKGIQELAAENKELKAEVKDLNARLERLEKLLEGK